MGMDERNGSQCEGGNARRIAWSHFGCCRPHQKQKAEAETCNAQFTTKRQPVLGPAVTLSKTRFKHRSIQIKGNFMKLNFHLYLKCIIYFAGLIFCSVYCQ